MNDICSQCDEIECTCHDGVDLGDDPRTWDSQAGSRRYSRLQAVHRQIYGPDTEPELDFNE